MGRNAEQERRYQELKAKWGIPDTASVAPSGPGAVTPNAPQAPGTSGPIEALMPPAAMKDAALESKADIFDSHFLPALVRFATLGTNQDQTMDLIQKNLPDWKVEKKGPKGGYLSVTPPGGEEHTWKPGMRFSDINRGLTAMALGAGGTALAGMAMPAALATAVPVSLAGMAAGALGGLAGAGAVEAPKVLAGGKADPSSLALAAGLGMAGPAVGEAMDFANARATAPAAPQTIGQQAAQAATEGVNSAAAQGLAGRYGGNLDTLRAARDLNVHVPTDMLADMTPEAQQAARYSQATKSAASMAGGTGLQQQNDEIKAIADRIRGLTDEFGGAPGTGRIDGLVRDDRALEIAGLRSQEKPLYQGIRDATGGQPIPQDLRIVKWIEDEAAKHRDGLTDLPAELQRLHAKLAPRIRPADPVTGRIPPGPRVERPTYTTLERERQAMGGNAAPTSDFPDQYKGEAKNLHSLMSADEADAAVMLDVDKQRDAAHALTRTRKAVEEKTRDLGITVDGNLVNSNIPDLQGDIMPGIRKSFAKLSKGDVGDFVQNMNRLPAARRPEAAVTALDDVFHGSAENPVNFAKFREEWGLLRKQPQSMAALADHLPPGMISKMDSAYQLAKDIGRLGGYQSKTGATLNNSMAQAGESFLDKVLDFLPFGRAAGSMAGAAAGNVLAGPRGSMAGAAAGNTAGGGFSRLLKTIFQGAGDPGVVARDALLASPEFRSLVVNVANQAPKAPTQGLISRMVTPVVTSKPFVAILEHAKVPGNDGRRVLEHAVKSALAGATVAEVNSPANRKKD